ncbi:translation initiation factor eIF-2B alpha/beta/delta subunit family protein [Actinokineospora bangkokensis]|uniref:Methylthioribose-1-phosphate isomerase n=1 Tax=Actinokineospora bangkokensis TaxID=1193682 RepID=A0A1Q9LM04_9PSEU|nr:methylthioribose-1-phosphate isomerase [Actinokineospora bangkokensis]OLR93045.1 methylthioribose-1-phosphate isomerase [Actinokineospora bangkokensis]
MTALAGPVLADSVLPAEDGVRILDRRVFPHRRTWVLCTTVEDVARAIEDMVTQSSGPYFAAAWGMALAARTAVSTPDPRAAMERAGRRLVATRPTNNHIGEAVDLVLSGVDYRDLVGSARAAAAAADARYRERSRVLGSHAAALLPDGAALLTHCWADFYLIGLVEGMRAQGKDLSVFCTETRPYRQGARLTAPTLAEMGVPTTLVTDGTGAALLASGRVDALVTAADRVTADGHVVNKVGTLGLAVAAHAFDVPYLAMVRAPDPTTRTGADVPIEHRPAAELLDAAGVVDPAVDGLYPAFDITPPRFVTTVVTDRGPFAPTALSRYEEAA